MNKTINVSVVLCFVLIFILSCNRPKSNQSVVPLVDTISPPIAKGTFIGMLKDDSVFVSSQTIENDWQTNIIVYLGNLVLYKESDKNLFHISRSNTKIIQLNTKDVAYILLTQVDVPATDKWLILKVDNKQVIDTYIVIKQIFKDMDNDGFFEIGGREFTDAACIDCDSIYYSPFKIFKLNQTFEFDSVLSKELTIRLYGTFLGFDYNDTILKEQDSFDSLSIFPKDLHP